MSTSTLRIEGEHRHWTIQPYGIQGCWTVSAHPLPADSNPMDYWGMPIFPDLTDAYDAYVAAEFADDGTHTEETYR